MATTFLEPGGDADFAVATTNGFWSIVNSATSIATDFVHGAHIKSIRYHPGTSDFVSSSDNIVAASGSRCSLYLYFVAYPTSTANIFGLASAAGGATRVGVRMTSTGIIQLWNGGTAQIGTNGSTLSLNIWYRISIAAVLTSTTVNEVRLFTNSILDISVTNATLASIGISDFKIGNSNNDTTLDFRSSDHYVDNSNSLIDTGNIWVTAKRPNGNGTTNGFNVQIGSGGSGYGTGHSPQVNERPLSTTNGWSVVGAGSAVTEEYNIENKSTGDIDISSATIIDYLGWVSASSVTAETASIIVNNVTSNISLTSSAALFTSIAGSSTYPAGTGADIGMVTSTTVTTVGLYECGVLVAYIPTAAPVASPISNNSLLTLACG